MFSRRTSWVVDIPFIRKRAKTTGMVSQGLSFTEIFATEGAKAVSWSSKRRPM